MTRRLLTIALISICLTAKAGLHERTIHSRANCFGNNESITWHAGHSYRLKTYSAHIDMFSNMHEIKDNWRTTWRSAAVHWDEAYVGDSYTVIGNHWINEGGKPRKLGETVSRDCSGYDGWWG